MKRRILLVDDELAILLTLKTILEIHQFEVETASSAKEATTKLKANTYHMVITDMKMEHEKAGYDVIRAAKKDGLQSRCGYFDRLSPIGRRLEDTGRKLHAGKAHEYRRSAAPY